MNLFFLSSYIRKARKRSCRMGGINSVIPDVNATIQREQESKENIINRSFDTAQGLGQGIAEAYVDTERGVLKTAGNFGGDVLHTGRYVAKNVVALGDNVQDNITTVIQDIRVDITNTIQISIVIGVIGITAFMILYGDKIMERGINVAGLELF